MVFERCSVAVRFEGPLRVYLRCVFALEAANMKAGEKSVSMLLCEPLALWWWCVCCIFCWGGWLVVLKWLVNRLDGMTF